MNCLGCSRENDPRRRFCGGCGAALRWGCPRCGFENGGDDAYCGGCGDAVGTSVPRPVPVPRPVMAPKPAPVLAPAPATADDLGAAEMRELLSVAQKPAAAAPLSARVSQDELDDLFASG